MAEILFDATLLRAQFPAFANTTTYPDALLEAYWDQATNFIDICDYGMLAGKSRVFAINMMACHLIKIAANMQRNKQGGFVSSSTIDKVSVQKLAPPVANQWQWWLNQTPYGQQLLALLQVHTVGGIYVGGAPESGAFRKVGGFF